MAYTDLDIADGKWFLYVIKLQHGYYYVGITKDVKRRMGQHNNGKGARATRLHKPRELMAVYELGRMSYEEAQNYEDAFTLGKIIQFGSWYLGGRYCSGCRVKVAEKHFEKLAEKYKAELPTVDVDFEFKKIRTKKKSKKKKNKERQRMIAKAEAENRRAIRQRFGSVL